MPEPAQRKLRVSWSIPAPVILSILGMAAANIWVAATWKTTIEKDMDSDRNTTAAQLRILESRIGIIEQNAAGSIAIIERVKGVEVNVQVLKEQNVTIEGKIDKLIDRAGNR